MTFAAVILAGGAGSRFGADKTEADLDGRALLEHVRAAVVDADEVVIVGAEVQGGPLAAIGAGVAQVSADEVATLAADQPFIAGAVQPLRNALDGHDVAVLVTGDRQHYLSAVWRRDALVAALARIGDLENRPVRLLFDDVRVAEVLDEHGWSLDIDTPDDLGRARRRL